MANAPNRVGFGIICPSCHRDSFVGSYHQCCTWEQIEFHTQAVENVAESQLIDNDGLPVWKSDSQQMFRDSSWFDFLGLAAPVGVIWDGAGSNDDAMTGGTRDTDDDVIWDFVESESGDSDDMVIPDGAGDS